MLGECGSIAIVMKKGSGSALEVAARIYEKIKSLGGEAFLALESNTDTSLSIPKASLLEQRACRVIVIGGDGTFLRAVRILKGRAPAMMLVGVGRRCFYYDVSASEALRYIEDFMRGRYVIQHYPYIAVEVNGISDGGFINETVIAGNHMKVVKLEVTIGSQRPYEVHGDGIIVATSAGSTAYSLSAGGPIVDQELDSLIVVPLNPVQLSVRPIVTSLLKRIRVHVSEDTSCRPRLIVDGELYRELEPGSSVTFRFSGTTVRVARFKKVRVHERLLGKA
uniref:NAD kinase n=1 Tax=Fervidicoccus fontis TaxID=683846 RepID=A0A7J3ZJB2_9CREN